jgi:hypothetical protein
MAQAKFRHYPVYVAKKKIATMSAVTHDIESGDELQFGSEGVLGHSDGIATCTLEADCVVPVSGSPIDFLGTILNKRDVDVMIFADGKFQTFTGRIVSANYSSNSRNGEARGKFRFTGAAPVAAG